MNKTPDVTVQYINEVKCKIVASREIMYALKDKFSFFANGYKFTPKFKMGVWDGKISMIDGKGLFYSGLLKALLQYCKEKGLTIKVEEISRYMPDKIEDSLIEILSKYVRFAPYDYQLKSVKEALSKRKLLILSPTSSGKSCMQYMLYRYCVDNNMKLLITVPSTSLCEQLYSDFEDYVSDDHAVSDHVAKLYGGQDKTVDKLVYISTWQTCSNMDKEWLSQFEFYIADEAHQAQAKELSSIIDSLENCRYRIGLTGTLNGTSIHELEMHARFGEIFKMITTRELIERGIVTDININMVRLTHEKSDVDFFHSICKNDYQREIDYIISSENRNKYIVNLGLTLSTNTLLLFNRIDAHGMKLYEMMQAEAVKHKKKIFYITGSVKTKDREIIRKSLDSDLPLFYDITLENGTIVTVDGEFYDLNKVKDLIGKTFKSEMFTDDHLYIGGETNSIVTDVNAVEGSFNLLATYGTLAVGVNIKRLHNLVFCHPFKARILNLQSIGRLLRKSEVKSKVYLYDLIDDYRKGKKTNHAYKHAVNRMEIYEEEGFEYDIIEQRI